MKQVEKDFERLYINFKQDDDYMSIADYEQVLKSTKIIFENITQDIMNIGSDAELMVYAPQKGCIITIFGISISAYGIFKFLESDMGKAFIKELTGHEPAYWTGQFGKLIRTIIVKIYFMTQEELEIFIEKYRQYDEMICKLDKSRKAVSNVFQMCKNNQSIEAIGFEKEDIYAIRRDDFEEHITGDITKDLDSRIVFKRLKIIRPVTANNLRDKWTLSEIGTSDGQSYIMEDARFQAKTLNGNFVKQGTNDDEIEAEVEYKIVMKNGEEKPKDRKILKVYTMNGESFEDRTLPVGVIFDEPKIIVKKVEEQIQTSLFDVLNNNGEDENA